MPLIPEKELEELRTRADIVQVIGERLPLKRAGQNFKGLCPFHTEKTPSFMVHPEKQIYHCFGCGEGGNVFSFLMKYEGIEFVEAAEQLAERYGIALSRVRGGGEGEGRGGKGEKELFLRINRLAGRFFHETLMREVEGRPGRDYLERRGIREGTIREALLGYATAGGKALAKLFSQKGVPPEAATRLGLVRAGAAGDLLDFFRDRVIFPILSADGKILGFSGRVLDGGAQPKYLNSPESLLYHKGDSLLGLSIARPAIRERDEVILVEGNFDLIRLQQEGIRHVVAPLGTALTEAQVRVLARMTRNFILLFDGDEAGLRASERALEVFLPLGIFPKVVLLPAGEDPDSFTAKGGIEPLQRLLAAAPSLIDLRIERIFSQEGKGPEGVSRAVRRIGEVLSLLPGELEKRLYLRKVAERVGLAEDLVFSEISRKGGGVRKGSNFSAERGDEGRKRLPPLERTVLEVILSGSVPQTLFGEIEAADFTDSDLGTVWTLLKEDFLQQGAVDVSRLLLTVSEEPIRRLVARLSMGSERWKAEGAKVATACLRQMKVFRLKGRLKGLSEEIHEAERSRDSDRMRQLLDQKSRLLKEMGAGRGPH